MVLGKKRIQENLHTSVFLRITLCALTGVFVKMHKKLINQTLISIFFVKHIFETPALSWLTSINIYNK